MSLSQFNHNWPPEVVNVLPKLRNLKAHDFTASRFQDYGFALEAIERVIQRFNVLKQSTIPASCARYTLNFLTKYDWVPRTNSIAQYPFANDIPQGNSMYYTKWLLVSTIWPQDANVLNVVPVMSSPSQIPSSEYEARFEGNISKLPFAITEPERRQQQNNETAGPIVLHAARQNTGNSQDMNEFLAPVSERLRYLEAQLKEAKKDELAEKMTWHDNQLSYHSKEMNKLRRQAEELEGPRKRQRTG
ncbi:hypothetical protein F53441_6291 [Fusarium austroafricanum]|uniref:Uncharacterized protein n=1 Tax=Fusarium austroafricanum TaxID=2364996 RepID=A0A8H4NWS4_9HYPO|nr:hypothetical protein F53441_6291 [Fusarium austroafricanum]